MLLLGWYNPEQSEGGRHDVMHHGTPTTCRWTREVQLPFPHHSRSGHLITTQAVTIYEFASEATFYPLGWRLHYPGKFLCRVVRQLWSRIIWRWLAFLNPRLVCVSVTRISFSQSNHVWRNQHQNIPAKCTICSYNMHCFLSTFHAVFWKPAKYNKLNIVE